MGLYNDFDAGFDDKEVNASFSRKCADGDTDPEWFASNSAT
jgi:hypothetical protein